MISAAAGKLVQTYSPLQSFTGEPMKRRDFLKTSAVALSAMG